MFYPKLEVMEKLLRRSINTLLRDDVYLLEHGVAERAITHRLAVYLEQHFPHWNVDCEYNRHGHDVKRVNNEASDDRMKVYPDIIIHHRGTSNNLLAIEVKTTRNPQANSSHDQHKLREYKISMGYKYTVFVLLKNEIGELCGVEQVEWL